MTSVGSLEVEEYLTWLTAEKGRSVNTVTAYRRDLLVYCGWLYQQRTTLETVTPADLSDYVGVLRQLRRSIQSSTFWAWSFTM